MDRLIQSARTGARQLLSVSSIGFEVERRETARHRRPTMLCALLRQSKTIAGRLWLIARVAVAAAQLLQRTTSRYRKFTLLLHNRKMSAILRTWNGGQVVMGIESLNSAVAAAGFAMVSDMESDGAAIAGAPSSAAGWSAPQPGGSKSQALALVDAQPRVPATAPAQSLSERVSGLLDAWRPKG